MTASRLPVLFLTLERTPSIGRAGSCSATARACSSPARSSSGSTTRARASSCRCSHVRRGRRLLRVGQGQLSEARHADAGDDPAGGQARGGLTWEYYFDWEGGAPPWVSAMAQGTGLEALSTPTSRPTTQSYLTVAHQMLPLLETKPETGVGVRTPRGRRYLQYSFLPNTDIINAFLQTFDRPRPLRGGLGRQDRAAALQRGNAQAIAELPSFNTGAWSLYQPGQEDDLSYHELVTGFAQDLCQLTRTPVYCTTATDIPVRPEGQSGDRTEDLPGDAQQGLPAAIQAVEDLAGRDRRLQLEQDRLLHQRPVPVRDRLLQAAEAAEGALQREAERDRPRRELPVDERPARRRRVGAAATGAPTPPPPPAATNPGRPAADHHHADNPHPDD